MPFLLTHGQKTARSILMVHGYTDSPYYVRTLADVFFAQGYNVIAILLPGHGTKPEDLLDVKLSQWQDETRFGFGLAAQLGDEVSVAGFSTGGALVLQALAANDASYAPRPAGGVFLFSPALEIAGDVKTQLQLAVVCAVPGHLSGFKPWVGDADAPETNPYRYVKMAVNGACQVYDLTLENIVSRGEILSAIKKGTGVFAVESEADTMVSPQAVVDFMGSLPVGTKQDFILYPKSDAIRHEDVTRSETNPFYAEVAARIRAFLAPPPSSATLNALDAAGPAFDPADR
jgi:esterase/lipase